MFTIPAAVAAAQNIGLLALVIVVTVTLFLEVTDR